MTRNSENFDLVSFFSYLYKWRKALTIQLIVLSISAVVLALIVPKTYSSSATILPPGGGGLLSSFLPSEMTRGLSGVLGSSAFDPAGETSKIMAILKSRSLAEKTIYKFDLLDRFESKTIEEGLIAFKKRLNVSLDEDGTITISVNLKTDFFHPEENEVEVKQLSQEICQFIADQLDEIYTALGTQKARFEREVIERRYNQNKTDIRDLEEEFKKFSEKNGVIALPEQTEAMIKTLADLEGQQIIEEVKLEIAKNSFSSNSPEIRQKELLIEALRSQKDNLLKFGSSEDSLSTLPAFAKTPDLALTYARLEREITVQSLIYEFLTQQVEQLKLQEAKDTPSIQFIDLPQAPTKRSAPTRSLLTIFIVVIGMIMTVCILILVSLFRERIMNAYEKIKMDAK